MPWSCGKITRQRNSASPVAPSREPSGRWCPRTAARRPYKRMFSTVSRHWMTAPQIQLDRGLIQPKVVLVPGANLVQQLRRDAVTPQASTAVRGYVLYGHGGLPQFRKVGGDDCRQLVGTFGDADVIIM